MTEVERGEFNIVKLTSIKTLVAVCHLCLYIILQCTMNPFLSHF